MFVSLHLCLERWSHTVLTHLSSNQLVARAFPALAFPIFGLLLFLYSQRMTQHRLVATDIVHAIPLAAVAGVGYLFAGLVEGTMLAALLTGSIPAVIVTNLLAEKIPGRVLQLGMAAVLLAADVKILE